MTHCTLKLTALGTLALAACQTLDTNEPTTEPAPSVSTVPSATLTPSAAQAEPQAAVVTDAPTLPKSISVQGVGTYSPAPALRSAVRQINDLADTDHDGVVTRSEATGALNFLVGGVFFRADENSDGKLSAAERQTATSELKTKYADAYSFITSVASKETLADYASMLNSEAPEQLSLSQTRKAVVDTVDAVFKTVDTNQDNRITPLEADEGINAGFAALGKVAFDRADSDRDKRLTLSEVTSALESPLSRAFEAADNNGDGVLTATEAASMMSWMSERIDVFGEQSYDALNEAANVHVR